jgi:hypothetical protein
MIDDFIKALHSPSLHPAKASLIAGAFAALCMATAPWSTLIGVGFLVSALTFSVLSIRNKLYSGYTAKMDSNIKIDAHNCGGRAARDYINYGKSFINLSSWRHPIIFGEAMKSSMKIREAIAKRGSVGIIAVPTKKKWGFF